MAAIYWWKCDVEGCHAQAEANLGVYTISAREVLPVIPEGWGLLYAVESGGLRRFHLCPKHRQIPTPSESSEVN